MVKAIALFSGGLDSSLAIKIMLKQGIEVIALNFVTPFCRCHGKGGCTDVAFLENYEIKKEVIHITDEFIEIIKRPKHGYGKNMNPCIDCRILMLKKARKYMNDAGASFVFTGEVLGQRPMSQHLTALKTIEKESGLEGLILRPLSAKLLDETIPEKEGLVKRELLLDINGRSRKAQMRLAEELDLKDYPCPAGGCLLTDPIFSQRLKDLMKFGRLGIKEINLLKVGRHFRLSPTFKLVVGRDEKENKKLEYFLEDNDIKFMTLDAPGPVALLRANASVSSNYTWEGEVEISASIVAKYSDGAVDKKVNVFVQTPTERYNISTTPVLRLQLESYMIK